jgi:hypothetical protein
MKDSAPGIGIPPRACPFVALEDDRDRRANAPDPRHRCYAVPSPQPRALAHQEAYCLSSAFPSCTFFLDWAARAAANPVQTGFPAAATVTGPGPVPATRDALDPLGRPWATPPPWVAEPQLKTTRPALPSNTQLGAFPDPSDHAFDHDIGLPDLPPPVPLPAYQPPPAGMARPYLQPEAPAADIPVGVPLQGASSWSKPAGPVGVEQDAAAALPPDALSAGRLTGRPIDAAPPARLDVQARPVSAKAGDGSSDWSRPRRFEAYPTLGRRVRLRGISPVILGVFALMIAAVGLFLLPRFLSGNGGVADGSARPSGSVIATLGAPRATPKPTARSYTVKRGDALSAIARSLGLSVEQITCFNGLKNANVLSIGQVLLIPPADYTCPAKGGGGGPRPSPSPHASASPHS